MSASLSASSTLPTPSVLTIRMRDLVLPVRLGVYDSEKLGPRDVTLHLDITLATAAANAASRSDQLADTLDYAALELALAEVLAAQHYELLEHLCAHVAARVLAEPQAAAVRVEIVKAGALRHAPAVAMLFEATKPEGN